MKQEFLRRTALFSELSDEELARILVISRVVDFEGETGIFKEGDPGEAFYLVEQGAVRISRMTPLGEEALAVLREGSFFGEMCLLDDSPRSADAKAHEGPARLLEFRISELKELMNSDQGLSNKMLWTMCRTLASRLRDTNERFQSLFVMTSAFK